ESADSKSALHRSETSEHCPDEEIRRVPTTSNTTGSVQVQCDPAIERQRPYRRRRQSSCLCRHRSSSDPDSRSFPVHPIYLRLDGRSGPVLHSLCSPPSVPLREQPRNPPPS